MNNTNVLFILGSCWALLALIAWNLYRIANAVEAIKRMVYTIPPQFVQTDFPPPEIRGPND